MINLLDKGSCCPEQHQCCQNNQATVVADDFKLACSTSDEILLADLGHVSTDSRVTLKRVTHSSRVIRTGKKIALVHSSTVTTTRSWSRPGVVALASDLDGHAVLSFDLFNQIPTGSDLFGWVNDLDTFIKEKNVGLKEEQVSTKCASSTESEIHNDVSAVEKALHNESDKEGDQNPATGYCASGSELFTIRHSASFSQIGSTK
jgi:hypothetical protein